LIERRALGLGEGEGIGRKRTGRECTRGPPRGKRIVHVLASGVLPRLHAAADGLERHLAAECEQTGRGDGGNAAAIRRALSNVRPRVFSGNLSPIDGDSIPKERTTREKSRRGAFMRRRAAAKRSRL
jgi:hypothetical protein